MLKNGFQTYGKQIVQNQNLYKYNGKELQTDFDLDWYDYGARFYDVQLGRFHVNDAYAEKYYDLSNYQYAANNPIVNIDINGDSIWFTTQYDKSGELSGVTMNVTGTVIDNTKRGLTKKQIERKRGHIDKGIKKAFIGSEEGIDFKIITNITISENEGSIKSGDHVYRLVDDVAKETGTEKESGSLKAGNADPFQNVVYLDASLMAGILQRTAAHETFHSAGLPHIVDDTEITKNGEMIPLSIADYPNNLMHQAQSVATPGFKIETFQIRKIVKFNDWKMLNRGNQK